MMGRQAEQEALFYEFSLEQHVPADHMLRSIDRFVELGELRTHVRRIEDRVDLAIQPCDHGLHAAAARTYNPVRESVCH